MVRTSRGDGRRVICALAAKGPEVVREVGRLLDAGVLLAHIDPRFADLMEQYLHGALREVQLAAGAVSVCVEHHPPLADPWLSKMLRRMQEKNVHDAVRRMGMWVFQFVAIAPRLAGRLAQVSFDALQDVSQPIAMRVFAMTVLTRLCQDQPDLSREVRTVIEAMLPYGTGAFVARARQEMRRLVGAKDLDRLAQAIARNEGLDNCVPRRTL